MMKHLFATCILICFSKMAHAQWIFLGGCIIPQSEPLPQPLSFCFDSIGDPYVSYASPGRGIGNSYMVHVTKFNGIDWILDTIRSLTDPNYFMYFTSITMRKNGSTILAYTSLGNNNNIMTQHLTNGAWAKLDTIRCVNDSVAVIDLSIVTARNDTPYLAFTEGNTLPNEGPKITVARFNGTHWVRIGQPINTKSPSILDLQLDSSSTPYINTDSTIMKFDGNNWVTMNTVKKRIAGYTIDPSGIPYIVTRDSMANSVPYTSIYKLISGTWIKLGPSVKGSPSFLSAITLDPAGLLYIFVNDTLRGSVQFFDGTQWHRMGLPMDEIFYNWNATKLRFNQNGKLFLFVGRSLNGWDSCNILVLTYTPGVGFYEIDANDRLSVYPNPTNSKTLHLFFPQSISTSETLTLTITDIKGCEVICKKGTISELDEIEISNLSKGVYFITLSGVKTGKYTEKIIRE